MVANKLWITYGINPIYFRPEWRNWQTRRIQNPVPVRECGFDSHLRYHFGAEGLNNPE